MSWATTKNSDGRRGSNHQVRYKKTVVCYFGVLRYIQYASIENTMLGNQAASNG